MKMRTKYASGREVMDRRYATVVIRWASFIEQIKEIISQIFVHVFEDFVLIQG
jgi:hypothetical protein